MNVFYRENFDEHSNVIFTKFCKFHDLNETETLEHYKRSLNWNNDVISVKHTKVSLKFEAKIDVPNVSP